MLSELIIIEPANHTMLRRLWCDYVERLYRSPGFVGTLDTQAATIRALEALGHQIGLSFWLFVKKNATPDEYRELRTIAKSKGEG